MYLGSTRELNIIDLGLRVHTFTLEFDTKGSVTYAKRIKQCEVKTQTLKPSERLKTKTRVGDLAQR